MKFWWVLIDSRTRPTCSIYVFLLFTLKSCTSSVPNVVLQKLLECLMRHIVKLDVLKVFWLVINECILYEWRTFYILTYILVSYAMIDLYGLYETSERLNKPCHNLGVLQSRNTHYLISTRSIINVLSELATFLLRLSLWVDFHNVHITRVNRSFRKLWHHFSTSFLSSPQN